MWGELFCELERIGKESNITPSYNYRGYSLLLKYGIFAHVLESGIVKNGDEIEVLE